MHALSRRSDVISSIKILSSSGGDFGEFVIPGNGLPQPRTSSAEVSSRPVFMINARAQRKLPHTRIISVIVKQHLVQIGRIDGPAQYSSQILAAEVLPTTTSLRYFLVASSPRALGWVPRKQNMLKGHLLRVIYHLTRGIHRGDLFG